jgi:hypothetical protein
MPTLNVEPNDAKESSNNNYDELLNFARLFFTSIANKDFDSEKNQLSDARKQNIIDDD